MASKYAIYPSLRDRVVVISGGATGIGASLVEHFALQGSQVVFLDIQDAAAETLIESLKTRKQQEERIVHIPEFIHCDLTDINNSLKPACDQILREKTTFLTPALIASGGVGSVVNMGSITWAVPATGLVPYTTSKAAIVGLTRTLAHELGPHGVRVNSILPGAIATERQKQEILTEEYQQWVFGRQALKKMLQPDDVARMALWLVADDSESVTNQGLVVDGGWI